MNGFLVPVVQKPVPTAPGAGGQSLPAVGEIYGLRGQRAATDGGGSYAAPVPPGQGALGGAAWQQQTCCPLARRQLGSAPDCVVT